MEISPTTLILPPANPSFLCYRIRSRTGADSLYELKLMFDTLSFLCIILGVGIITGVAVIYRSINIKEEP